MICWRDAFFTKYLWNSAKLLKGGTRVVYCFTANMASPMLKNLTIFSKLRSSNVGVSAYQLSRHAHSFLARKLLYCDYGEPTEVLKVTEEKLKAPKANEVLIELLAAPINPADINTIQGVYPKKPQLPATPGNEGVGRVVALGNSVTSLKEGDHVIPNESNLGTWRTHGIWDANQWYKVPSNLPVLEAATMTVNPMTAYRMLKDFVDLKPGDTVIQNGANSACGQNVIQLCRAWGITSINIVRDRPSIDNLKESLMSLGASHVLTEEELRGTTMFKQGGIKPPKLALNCVGGQSGIEVLRRLDHGGTMVTYGGMSRNPVTVPTSALIFKDFKVVGFWMTRWQDHYRGSPKGKEMYDDIMKLIISGKLRGPAHRLVSFRTYDEALQAATNSRGFTGEKIILSFCDN